ncbi:hypothetical protein [Candidimonas nitroreducens]|nr:hypothetical protein [Candidimonas nitroreducens]
MENTEQRAGHTPGPWIYYADTPSADPNWHIVTTANRMRVLANVHIEPGNGMDVANARLIAAAPDLVDALRVAYSDIRRLPGYTIDMLGRIEAAIARATGDAQS